MEQPTDEGAVSPLLDSEVVDNTSSRGAPYMSYKGLINLITRLYENGVPDVFDKSYFGNQSGSLTAQIRTTLKILDLIDGSHVPTPLLRSLVEAGPDRRKEHLIEIAKQEFSDVLALGQNATAGQLAGVFRSRGLSGATVSKAISFYLGMCEDLAIPISPHFKKGRSALTSSSNGSRKRRSSRTQDPAPQVAPIVANPPVTATTIEAQRAAYVEMLMKLASSTEAGLQEGILDRIERALELGEKAGPQDT
ncbi:hypothetical protein [Homoserinimonas sp. A520]